MQAHPRKLDKLKKRLQLVLGQEDLRAHRQLIQKTGMELGVDPLDCAAALLFISQPHLFQNTVNEQAPSRPPLAVFKQAHYRNVRYRLDVGKNHHIDQEQLLSTLVEESGVDKKRIARIDIRDSYTLVDLPEGMPADIFQLLSEATVQGHPLNIKRIKPNRRKPRDPKQIAE
ncbi:DbpA RNA binding domain-containing protein [Methylomonas sp. SURF-2]|uniref:DbpA RNA binding domain-containing protein n=1 Tax=Methylomonas subterranea TaxID=2952225 RepID=A0ABT1TM95_9GAMM|nr:DbpA RNA binding domain-containing protein [Methylomonas sp. SURF-2]MCQ8106338.1 DbpA RNA binding domain-containing protein [Methylomonas sp. SURF-2]